MKKSMVKNGAEAKRKRVDGTFAIRLVQSILLTAINGAPHLRFRSARELARSYRENENYKSDHERIRALIRREASKNFSIGFVTSLGGLITLPIAVPTSLSASWIIQTRLAAAIADLSGHDLNDEAVQMLTLLCIAGDSTKEIVKRAGVSSGASLTKQAVGKVSAEAIARINQQVGFRLLATAGGAGLVRVSALVPVAGGIIGGTVDAVACSMAGAAATSYFTARAARVEVVDAEVIESA